MGPTQNEILRRKRYVLYDDDYSRYSWVEVIREKSNTFDVFEACCHRLQCEKGKEIRKTIYIRGDHDREFENSNLNFFYIIKEIANRFLTLILSGGQIKNVKRMNNTL